MKICLLLLSVIPVLFCCNTLPVIEHLDLPQAGSNTNPFLKGKHQLTHSIKAELPNGDRVLIIGITLVDAGAKTMDAVIMTVEGLVLFDVSYKDNNTFIKRSVPPFDASGFAKGLIDDVKLIYFAPDCRDMESGALSGRHVNRYSCDGGDTIDVIAGKDGSVGINKYRGSSLLRTVNILSISKEGIPERIELFSHGLFGYSLYLELISSEEI